MKSKFFKIIFSTTPIVIMIGLIPLIKNDYSLVLIYSLIISISFVLLKERSQFKIFFFGFFVMIIAETIFISTGVETFNRNTLFGLMPIWLPFLWGYNFVAIKRGIKILEL